MIYQVLNFQHEFHVGGDENADPHPEVHLIVEYFNVYDHEFPCSPDEDEHVHVQRRWTDL